VNSLEKKKKGNHTSNQDKDSYPLGFIYFTNTPSKIESKERDRTQLKNRKKRIH
jgi:hypothetical protein